MSACLQKGVGTNANSVCIGNLPDDIMDLVAREFVHEVMRKIYSSKGKFGYAQVLLCNDVDHTLMTIYQR